MAVVGDAYVMIHAITSGVESDIKKAFKDADKFGEDAGKKVGQSFNKGFKGSSSNTSFADSLSKMFGTTTKDAVSAANAFTATTQAGYFLGSTLAAAAGAIGSLASSLVSLVGVTLAAAPAAAVLSNAILGLAQVAGGLKIAFRGVGDAIQAGIKAQQTSRAQIMAITKAELSLKRAREDLSQLTIDAAQREQKAIKDVADTQRELNLARIQAAEQIKQLKFDSEDAAITEKKAAIELEKARETLARVSDLPPNSRVRKEAELAFASADLNYRRAIDKNNTLKSQEARNAAMGTGSMEDQVKGQQNVIDATYAAEQAKISLGKTEKENAKNLTRATEDIAIQEKDLDFLKKGGAAADAYAVALSKLSESAKEFAKYIIGLKGVGKDLQEAIGKELFPRLEKAIQTLVDKLLPTLKPLLADLGKSLGDVATHLADVLTRADNLERIKRIWTTNDEAIVIFGDSIGNLLDSFLLLADAARPLVLEFANWTKNITAAWKATLEADTKSGKLLETLRTAADVVKKLGHLFGETFGAIGNLVKANVGPGSGGYYLLDYLTNAMTGLKNLTNVDGTPLKAFFLQGAENAGKVLDVLGFLLKEILKIGASKEFGQFADSIKAAEPSVSKLFDAFKEGLPAFGRFIKQIADFLGTVTSGVTIKVFFDTLAKGLEKLNDFLKTDAGKKLIDLGNVIIPTIAAFALLGKGVGFFGDVVIGNIAKLEGLASGLGKLAMNIPGVSGAVTKLKQELAMLTYGFEFASAPVLAIAAGVALLIAAFVLMYAKSEILRKAIGDLVSGVFQALQDAFNKINDAIKNAFPSINGIMGIFKTFGDFIGTYIVPIIKFVLVGAIGSIADTVIDVIKVIKNIITVFTDVFNGIKKIIGGIILLFQGDFVGGLKNIFGGVGAILTSPFKLLIEAIKSVLNTLINTYNNTLAKLSIKTPSWFFGGQTIGFPTIPKLAKGGIIQPSAGGTIARIGEAGKAERVEPLDSQGLSARDRAIIDRISGGNGGAQINMTINASPGMDERELAAIVSRQLNYEMRRGAA
jgi:hypothetical protein